jgi:hypothetical protein
VDGCFLASLRRGVFVIHPHTFGYLRSVLGTPTRTFSYAQSGVANVEDHLWRCGCAAREQAAACDLVACGRHGGLNGPAPLDAAGAY